MNFDVTTRRKSHLALLARVVNLVIFKLPYYGIYQMTKICGGGRNEILYMLPFRNLKFPKILPDGNIIIVLWGRS